MGDTNKQQEFSVDLLRVYYGLGHFLNFIYETFGMSSKTYLLYTS